MWVVWVVGEGGVGAHHPTWGFMFLIFFTASREFCRYLDAGIVSNFYTHRGCCTQTWRDGCGEARTHSLPSTQEAPECENNLKFANYPNYGPVCCEGGPTILFLQMMICIIKMVRSVAKKTVRYDNCLHLIRIIWIIRLVAKSMVQYGNLCAKYLDYFDSLAPSKRNVHYYKLLSYDMDQMNNPAY